jgi:putative Holliday junction resolvase
MREGADSRPKVAIAFDFGRRRIGVAAGDTVTRRAAPVTTINCNAQGIDWATIGRLVEEWQPAILVVGIPTNVDATPAELTAPAREFARELETRHRITTVTVDERWSSVEATDRLRKARQAGTRTRRVRREDIDAASACVILEQWLANQ